MSELPWPKEWCEHLIKMYSVETRQQGKSLANAKMIKFLLRRNPNLVLGCYDVKKSIEDLREHFPTALFIVEGEYRLKIKILNKKELEL